MKPLSDLEKVGIARPQPGNRRGGEETADKIPRCHGNPDGIAFEKAHNLHHAANIRDRAHPFQDFCPLTDRQVFLVQEITPVEFLRIEAGHGDHGFATDELGGGGFGRCKFRHHTVHLRAVRTPKDCLSLQPDQSLKGRDLYVVVR